MRRPAVFFIKLQGERLTSTFLPFVRRSARIYFCSKCLWDNINCLTESDIRGKTKTTVRNICSAKKQRSEEQNNIVWCPLQITLIFSQHIIPPLGQEFYPFHDYIIPHLEQLVNRKMKNLLFNKRPAEQRQEKWRKHKPAPNSEVYYEKDQVVQKVGFAPTQLPQYLIVQRSGRFVDIHSNVLLRERLLISPFLPAAHRNVFIYRLSLQTNSA